MLELFCFAMFVNINVMLYMIYKLNIIHNELTLVKAYVSIFRGNDHKETPIVEPPQTLPPLENPIATTPPSNVDIDWDEFNKQMDQFSKDMSDMAFPKLPKLPDMKFRK